MHKEEQNMNYLIGVSKYKQWKKKENKWSCCTMWEKWIDIRSERGSEKFLRGKSFVTGPTKEGKSGKVLKSSW